MNLNYLKEKLQSGTLGNSVHGFASHDIGFSRKLQKQQQQQQQQKLKQVLGLQFSAISLIFKLLPNDPKEWQDVLNVSVEPNTRDGNFNVLWIKERMNWIVENVVIPQTSADHCAFIELLFGVTINGVPVVGTADTFHSYTWAEPFDKTFFTMRDVFLDESQITRYIWLDIFCQNQHSGHQVGGTSVANTFSSAMAQIAASDKPGVFLFSTPELVSPTALTRVWCLFELQEAIRWQKKDSKLEIQVIVHKAGGNENEKRLKEMGNVDPTSFLLDVRDAEATLPSDKAMILKIIEDSVPGGATEVNRIVAEVYKKTFLSMKLRMLVSEFNPNIELKDSVVVLSCINDGADPNDTDAYGNTALHIATKAGNLRFVETLLTSDFLNVNAANTVQQTPLHVAASHNRKEIASLLIEHGADENLKDGWGKTYHDIVAETTPIDQLSADIAALDHKFDLTPVQAFTYDAAVNARDVMAMQAAAEESRTMAETHALGAKQQVPAAAGSNPVDGGRPALQEYDEGDMDSICDMSELEVFRERTQQNSDKVATEDNQEEEKRGKLLEYNSGHNASMLMDEEMIAYMKAAREAAKKEKSKTKKVEPEPDQPNISTYNEAHETSVMMRAEVDESTEKSKATKASADNSPGDVVDKPPAIQNKVGPERSAGCTTCVVS